MEYRDIITVEADKRGGRACIRGLRITAGDVLSYLAAGMTEYEIVSDFPDLTREDSAPFWRMRLSASRQARRSRRAFASIRS